MTAISNEKKRIRIKSHWAADKATSKIPKKSRVAADILSRHAWMNTLLTCHGWVNCIVGYSEWQAKHVCLFKLLKEVMWTSFLILWLYVFHTLNCDALCVTGQHILINWHMFLFLSSKSFCFFAFCSKVYHKRIEDNQGGFFFLFLIF